MDAPRNRPEPEPVAIVRAWVNAAGPEVARVAFPLGLVGGRLQVVVAHENWLRELEGHRQRLLERIRRETGMSGVLEIVFLQESSGSQGAGASRARPQEDPVHAGPIPSEILTAADAIADAEMGRRLARVAANLLARVAKRRPLL